jgi:hypothetical protein
VRARHAFALAALPALACGGATPEQFCATLEDLATGEVAIEPRPNELRGHVSTLKVLLENAPSEIRGDLETLRKVFTRARDAGGFRALLVFEALTDNELAAVEGRIADYAGRHCGDPYAELASYGWEVGEAPDEEPPCPGWPRVGSPLTNNRFPYLLDTSAANYFSTTFWSVPFVPAPPGFIRVPRGGSVELRGEYPHARYFAFHPNDVETNNLATLVDIDLDPDEGSANPWRGPVPTQAGRRFTARLEFSAPPAERSRIRPNTSYVGERAGGGFNPAVFLLYRVYGSDLGALPPNSSGVALPALTVRDAEGEIVEHFDECQPYPEGREAAIDRTRFPALPIPDHRAVTQAGTWKTAPNWGLAVDLLANADVLYLSSFYGRRNGEVFAVRARRPQTPDPAAGLPLWSGTEIRMWSACTYNFWNGRANDCLHDSGIAANEDGDYTLVVSDDAHRPANAVPEAGVTWLDAGPFLDGQLSLRMLLEDEILLRGLRAAVESGEAPEKIRPYVPRTAFCSRASFEAGGWEACAAAARD